MSAPILRKDDPALHPDANALIGTLLPVPADSPNAGRFMLVGFQLHKDNIMVPVWKDRKECMKEAKRKY